MANDRTGLFKFIDICCVDFYCVLCFFFATGCLTVTLVLVFSLFEFVQLSNNFSFFN